MALNKQVSNEDIIINRIRVIRGHLAGVENMIQSQKPHQDILTQLSAIRSAVHKVALLEAQRYVESVTNSADERNTSKTDITDAINKLMDLQLAAL